MEYIFIILYIFLYGIYSSSRQWGALESQRSYPNGVDVTLMASEGLSALAVTDVPQFGCEVTSSWDESVEVRSNTQRHTVSQMSSEDRLLCSCLNVPQKTGERSEVMLFQKVRCWSENIICSKMSFALLVS